MEAKLTLSCRFTSDLSVLQKGIRDGNEVSKLLTLHLMMKEVARLRERHMLALAPCRSHRLHLLFRHGAPSLRVAGQQQDRTLNPLNCSAPGRGYWQRWNEVEDVQIELSLCL